VKSRYPPDGGRCSPAKSLIADEPETVRPPRSLSAIFAIAVVGGVALLAAGAVAMFYVAPSQSTPDKPTAIDAGHPVPSEPFMSTLLPARKVVTTPIRVAVRRAAQPVQAARVEDSEALEQQDPRWARSGSERSTTDVATIMRPHALARENGIAAPDATVLFDPKLETGAIIPDRGKATHASETKSAAPAAEAPVGDETLPPGFKTSMRTVQINRGANMRSRPQSGSSVLTVVPKAASVNLVDCKVWCEVLYKGRRGYVFKDFAFGKARAPVKTKSAKDTAKETSTVSTSSAAQRPAMSQPPGVKAISARVQ
jgi:Bacterial SH3 domain